LLRAPTADADRPRTLKTETAEALAAYLLEAGIGSLAPYEAATGTSDDTAPELGRTVEVEPPQDGEQFVMRGEPELGGRRARLVDALLTRLESAEGTLTSADLEAAAWIARVVRFEVPLAVDPTISAGAELVEGPLGESASDGASSK
jgi:hypothetical protein